jgi:hypothetical protein
MGLFGSKRGDESSSVSKPTNVIPVLPVDLSKRYDIYYMEGTHDRLYENVRFVCIRAFEPIPEFSSPLIDGFFEIETIDGSRCLIPKYSIRLICEHGTQPIYKVIRHRRNWKE